MAEYPPYVGATGVLNSVFKKIIEAPPPPRFTQDFLTTKLGFKKGSANAVIPFLKRIGFLGSDGVPTELYSRFRNPTRGGYALGQGIKLGYSDLYSRNEYWHDLSKQELTGLLIEATGATPNSSTLKQILATIDVLKQYAKFDGHEEPTKDEPDEDGIEDEEDVEQQDSKASRRRMHDELGVNLSYTINLNLPETSDITVFDAIFKSLKENLLKK